MEVVTWRGVMMERGSSHGSSSVAVVMVFMNRKTGFSKTQVAPVQHSPHREEIGQEWMLSPDSIVAKSQRDVQVGPNFVSGVRVGYSDCVPFQSDCVALRGQPPRLVLGLAVRVSG